ncbi:HNH endonuclease signature motif containing protein [Mycobacterium sp. 1274761.0]|uniref:HNH endonuclease signature motif containing protein n=1 Tax=Mycobacterium sp. 1274761.0 TaxID=1834077 RepID=UPI0012E8D86C|nr:HNH endonuclease signature motif containing protein [Mycobacterium sp. 1274761.0]
MPSAAPRICARCRKAFTGRRCPCRPAWEGTKPRASRGARGQRLRAAKLNANPRCQWPGCRRPAVTVDHIVPLAEGGDEWAWENLQSLCHPCHDRKTRAEAQRGKTRLR